MYKKEEDEHVIKQLQAMTQKSLTIEELYAIFCNY